MSGKNSFVASTLGALEGTVSVLLTLFAGYVVARAGLLDHSTVRKISKLCSVLFLPCLIIEQMSPALTKDKIHHLWIIPVWGIVSTVIAHLLGWLGQVLFRTPHWLIVASGRPNTSALPLLLLQSLQSSGVLSSLSSGEDSSQILSRAKSFILLNVVIQQTITFQLAPAILKRDDGKEDDEHGPSTLAPPPGDREEGRLNPIVQDPEHVGLLRDYDGQSYGAGHQVNGADFRTALKPIEDRPDIHWPRRIKFLQKPVEKTLHWISPPLMGAIIALVIGMVTPLREAFFTKDSPLYSSITQSLQNLGELFVALQMFIVGAELAVVQSARPGFVSTSYALLIRYVLMPGLSLLFVWATAGRGWYVDDKLVWFILILMPSGPSAMLLVSVAELVNVDQGPIAAYLTIAYLFSPFMAVICSLGLLVVENASKRMS